MKKRIITAVIFLVLALSASLTAQAAQAKQVPQAKQVSLGSLSNFKVRNIYSGGQFGDVQNDAWYAMYVQAGYEFGILGGKSSAAFSPDDKLTYAEAVKTVACLHSIYYTGKLSFAASTTWYMPYVDYALKNGIIAAKPASYTSHITRADYARMIAKALPKEAYAAKNQIEDNAIPDVSMSDSYAAPVYTLYRAGVLAGCDKYGTFRPYGALTRAEASAITARASAADFRKELTFPVELGSVDIYNKSASAVFYLERYDSEGVLLGIGSGFFITRDGLALTNYHVIDGASSALIKTADGKTYNVRGLCGYDKTADLAILQIDGSGFNYLPIGDSSKLTTGADVYAIGSPFGLINTISEGIISSLSRELNGTDFFQYSAPISMGSGGGPVLNTKGEVVGVSCLTVLNGQTLNFAVPINKMHDLSRTDSVPLISIVAANAPSTLYYRGYYPVPDYGIFTSTPLYKTQYDASTEVKTYYYKLSDITAPDEKAVDGYAALLWKNGFEWQRTYEGEGGGQVDVYYNGNFDVSVHFGTDTLDGNPCRFVAIY